MEVLKAAVEAGYAKHIYIYFLYNSLINPLNGYVN